VAHESQAETISHILVMKAKLFFERGEFQKCSEDLDDAFRFAPSVSAKILRLRLFLANGDLESSKSQLIELLKEHPMYASFIFESMNERFGGDPEIKERYDTRLTMLRDFFLDMNDQELLASPSVILSKVRLLKEGGKSNSAHETLKNWVDQHSMNSEVMTAEYIKLLIDVGKDQEALRVTKNLLNNFHQSLTKHFCKSCGYNSDSIFWRCPQCHAWETIQFRWKV
jgi:lipopolysaccharide biosynthesis regulator YciM